LRLRKKISGKGEDARVAKDSRRSETVSQLFREV